MGKKFGSGSGMNNPDHISESLKNYFLGRLKYLNTLMWIRDRMEKSWIRDKHHPGSATLLETQTFLGPLKWHRAGRLFWAQMALVSLVAISEPKKVSISKAQPPPTCPRNGSAHIKNIKYGAVKIIGALPITT
jgi:hypothetical protein